MRIKWPEIIYATCLWCGERIVKPWGDEASMWGRIEPSFETWETRCEAKGFAVPHVPVIKH